MKILITGHSGFIGSNLINKIQDNKKYDILIITKNKKKHNKKFKYIVSDLNKIEAHEEKILNFSPDAVIHLAWQGIPNFSNKICEINYRNTIKFANICKKVKNLKKFISFGSCLEYKKKIGSCRETDNIDRKSNLSNIKSKIYKDLQILFENKNINLIWFRLFYVYGNNQRKGSLIPSIINSLKKNKSFEFKNPNNAVDYINVIDVIELIIIALNKNIKIGIYNIGYGKSYHNYEILNTINKLMLKTKPMIEISKNKKIYNFYSNNSKTINQFQKRPSIDLITGIRNILNEK